MSPFECEEFKTKVECFIDCVWFVSCWIYDKPFGSI